jgi:hypothetical protein
MNVLPSFSELKRCLTFYPEDTRSTFHRKVDKYQAHCTVSHPRRMTILLIVTYMRSSNQAQIVQPRWPRSSVEGFSSAAICIAFILVSWSCSPVTWLFGTNVLAQATASVVRVEDGGGVRMVLLNLMLTYQTTRCHNPENRSDFTPWKSQT